MWIKIKFINTTKETIIVPTKLDKKLKTSATLIFGSKNKKVNVLYSPLLSYNKKSSFETPITLLFSNDLKSRLRDTCYADLSSKDS